MTWRTLLIAAAILTTVPPLAGLAVDGGRRADLVGELSEMLSITLALSAAVLLGLEQRPAGATRLRRAIVAVLTSVACGALVAIPAIAVAPPTPPEVWAVRIPRFLLIAAATTLVVYAITQAVITSKFAKRSHS